MHTTVDNKLIIALDVETAVEARELFAELRDVAGAFKIGLQLFTAAGPQFVHEMVQAGARIFLDLKFHDIPNTVAAAGVEAARLGVFMFNVHAAGGGEMMRRIADAVRDAAARERMNVPKIVAVTVLTSADAGTLVEIGVEDGPELQVVRLAQLAAVSGLDGIVASPLEIAAVRTAITLKGFLIVTPGVRPADTPLDDQRRVTTPGTAVLAGADYVVVGRSVINAPDPLTAALAIQAELNAVMK